jgi:hypothetical protein
MDFEILARRPNVQSWDAPQSNQPDTSRRRFKLGGWVAFSALQ